MSRQRRDARLNGKAGATKAQATATATATAKAEATTPAGCRRYDGKGKGGG